MRTIVKAAFCALSLSVAVQGATADEFPSRPIRVIVPYAAGGPSDTGVRLVQDGLSRELGQPVVIENRGGGGLNATEAYVKSADRDGYTLLLGGIAPLTVIPSTKRVSYVAERDFLPIGIVWRSAQTLVVRPGLGVKTVAEFVKYAKDNPGKITVGSAGLGTVSHLGGELLKREAGIDLVHLPFRSTSESMPQLLGGQIDALFGDASTVAPQVASGKAVAIAVAAPQRSPALPDTPTFSEAGFPTVQAEGWHGLVALSDTPADRVQRLRDALRKAQSDPAYQARLRQHGATVGEIGPEAMAKLIREDTAKWSAIVKAANLKAE